MRWPDTVSLSDCVGFFQPPAPPDICMSRIWFSAKFPTPDCVVAYEAVAVECITAPCFHCALDRGA